MYARRAMVPSITHKKIFRYFQGMSNNVDPFEAMKLDKLHLIETAYNIDKQIMFIVDEMGNNLYHAAARYGRSDAIQWFHMRCKPNQVNEKNNVGYTPVHLASEKGYLHCVIALKMEGADLEERTFPDKKSPMHLAARNGHWPILNFLIREGCSMTEKDEHGYRPLDYAIEYGHDKAAEILAHHLQIPKPEVTVISPSLMRSNFEEIQAEKLREKRKLYDEICESLKGGSTFLDILRRDNDEIENS